MNDSEFLEVCLMNDQSAYNFRERRHEEWRENYMFYRDKVILNRLTQRQSVNIPLMKSSIKTILKDIDDAPMLYYLNLDNNAQREVFYNEYWKDNGRENKLVVKDIIDKKQVMLFGRSFKKLNIVNGRFFWEIIDPQDMKVDRYVDPSNLDTFHFMSQSNIFRPLSALRNNPILDQSAIKDLMEFYATEQGMVKAAENLNELMEKNERMTDMGVIDMNSPVLGETYVELHEDFLKVWDDDLEEEIIQFGLIADGRLLMRKHLCDVIGETKDNYWYNHVNFTTWADDPERTDFWSDSVADTLRTPNKVLNSMFSQLIENRTLRNWGMNFYNSSIENFTPQTYTATPFGWFPIPAGIGDNADIRKVIQRVEVADLSESIDEMNFILTMAEKATAATTTNQGTLQEQKATLGEIQLALVNAKERVKSTKVFYNDSWEEFGVKYTKMIEAGINSDILEPVTIDKKGKQTSRMYSRQIMPDKDLQSEKGWKVELKDVSSGTSEDISKLQKLNVARQTMPNNKPLDEIYKRKVLEFADLNANEVKEVMDAEKQQMLNPPMLQPPQPNGQGGTAQPNNGMKMLPPGPAQPAPMATQ